MTMFKRLLPVAGFIFCLVSLSVRAGNQMPDWVPEGFSLEYAQNFYQPDSIDDFAFSSPGDWKRVKVGDRFALEQGQGGDQYEPPHPSPHHIGLIRHLKFGSFILDFYVDYIGRTYGHADTCVFFNFADPANFYYAHIGADRDAKSHQIHIVDDSPRTPITKNPDREVNHDWDARTWHHIRLIRNARKGQIALFVNDMSEPDMLASDTTHQLGYIGFGSFDDKVRLTNIRIWAPQKKEEQANFFKGK